MKKNLAYVYVIALGMLFPTVAMSADCHPACGSGQSCCVMQYSNGTYGAPYCKNGSCYTSSTKQSLKNARELDASKFKEEQLPKSGDKDAKAPQQQDKPKQ
jgi:hypothetical protein